MGWEMKKVGKRFFLPKGAIFGNFKKMKNFNFFGCFLSKITKMVPN